MLTHAKVPKVTPGCELSEQLGTATAGRDQCDGVKHGETEERGSERDVLSAADGARLLGQVRAVRAVRHIQRLIRFNPSIQ